MTIVRLRCAHPGCPRLLSVVEVDEPLPPGTVEIRSMCPWHTQPGDFCDETYWDGQGNQILDPPEGW